MEFGVAERGSGHGVVCGDWEVCVSGAGTLDGVHSALHLHHGWVAISFGAANPV